MKNSKRGFSLVEMLVAVAVIAILSTLAIPALAGILRQGESVKTTRNAQLIATTYASARAAGAVFTSTDLRGKIFELFDGKRGGGKMEPLFFSVTRMKAAELDSVVGHLRYNATFDSIEVISP